MRWLWIDCIIEHEADKRLVAIKNVSLAEDYLHDHIVDNKPIMPFSLMIEGMAQTAGILVGTTSGFKEKVILAKISKASLSCDVTVGDTIRYEALIDSTILYFQIISR
jgi:3-hydroxyacyl-[acyl-carrier-protein] dehydratase